MLRNSEELIHANRMRVSRRHRAGRSLQRSVASNRGNERDIKHEPEFAVNSGYYFLGTGL